MNKFKYISGIILSGTLFFTSCTEDFETTNVDKKSPTEVAPEYLLSSVETRLMNHYMNVDGQSNVSSILAQHFSESQFPGASRFQFNDALEGAYIGNFYAPLLNTIAIDKNIANNQGLSDDEKNGWKLVTTSLRAFGLQHVTDANGPAIFSEAFNLDNLTPKYDTQEFIYKNLLEQLYVASSKANAATDLGIAGQDIIYKGDIAKWQKFANSLILRLAMRVAAIDPALSKEYVNKAVNENGGVFTSNADNALLQYLPTPNGSPWYEIASRTRHPGVSASNTIFDIQEENNDPRRYIYWRRLSRGPLVYGETAGVWTHTYVHHQYAGYQFSGNWGTSETPGVFMDYAEVEFFLAEAIVRGGYSVTGNAKNHYNNAVTASIEFQATINHDDSKVLNTEISDYLAKDGVDFDKAANKLVLIGREKWIALFFQGPEAWAEARRLDSPTMNIPTGKTAADLPVRLQFSSRESIINSSNVQEAITLLKNGGDEYTTKLWWDVN